MSSSVRDKVLCKSASEIELNLHFCLPWVVLFPNPKWGVGFSWPAWGVWGLALPLWSRRSTRQHRVARFLSVLTFVPKDHSNENYVFLLYVGQTLGQILFMESCGSGLVKTRRQSQSSNNSTTTTPPNRNLALWICEKWSFVLRKAEVQMIRWSTLSLEGQTFSAHLWWWIFRECFWIGYSTRENWLTKSNTNFTSWKNNIGTREKQQLITRCAEIYIWDKFPLERFWKLRS